MATQVLEIMNRELFSLHPDDPVDEALGYLLALGITGAPVIDDKGGPLGVVSMRDLARRYGGATVAERMTTPAVSVAPDAPLRDAARVMAERGYHRVPVVENGRVVGMVSAIDVVRALIGYPVSHPDSFPHIDAETGLVWTDDLPLDLAHCERAPQGPGILVLRLGGANVEEIDVWVEEANDVQARVHEIVSAPQSNREVARLIERFPQSMRFRASAIPDRVERREVLSLMRARVERWESVPPSGQR